MGADLSRVRFDARRDHSGVVMQQGRLLLDADWNELVAVLDRRLRADAADLGSPGPQPGIAGVAVVPRTTPDAFALALSGGDLTIGRGRMYVDGIVAENHGTGAPEFDALLSEPRGTAAATYAAQPYWPTPDALPAAGTHLVYLDAWTREVTYLEAPDLVEPAVGVDTTARMQTAWQVRVHAPNTPGITCTTRDADIPGWTDVIAPSAGRLTVDTIPVTDADDPCALPPTGGYRGLEHQSYRIEIHGGGKPGTATFKWSRDNGSVASPVVEVVSPTSIRPAELGKDDVLRFSTGDWVEITNDVREFDQVAGEMRKVEVHEEDGTLTFTPALPADFVMPAADAAQQHLRVRRWDQRGQIVSAAGAKLDNLDAPGSPGVITVPASGAAVVLESGLTAQLTAPGGVFRAGDYWIVAARSAQTPFPTVTAAPPLGIHHHYARLGVATFPSAVSDCRILGPAECHCEGAGGCSDCTRCVTPELHASGDLTIQDAINQVMPTGGTVCLAAGTYHLDEGGVTIANTSSITLRGQGARTLLVTPGRAVTVRSSLGIVLRDFSVIGARTSLVLADSAADLLAERLNLVAVAPADAPAAGFELRGISLLTTLRDNLVATPVGVLGGGAETLLMTAELDVTDNMLLCGGSGIRFEGRVAHLFRNGITDNTVQGGSLGALRALGVVGPSGTLTVSRNWIGTSAAGIEVGGSGVTVADNEVHGSAESGVGIFVEPSLFASLRGLTRITGNHVQNVGGAGISIATEVADLSIARNTVERALQGIVMDRKARAASATVSDNVVRDVGAELSELGGVGGILVVGAERADVESNTVVGVGAARSARDGSFGIGVLGCLDSRVAGNSVDRVGFDEAPGEAIGIGVAGAFRSTEVHGNTARRTDVDVDQDASSSWIGLLVGNVAVGVTSVGKYFAVETDAASYVVGGAAVFATDHTASDATVTDNALTGGGDGPAMRVGVRGNAVVSTNQARQRRETDVPSVQVAAAAMTVATNVAVGGRPSVDLRADPKRVAVLGNLTSTGIRVGGGSLGAPWDALNPSGVV